MPFCQNAQLTHGENILGKNRACSFSLFVQAFMKAMIFGCFRVLSILISSEMRFFAFLRSPWESSWEWGNLWETWPPLHGFQSLSCDNPLHPMCSSTWFPQGIVTLKSVNDPKESLQAEKLHRSRPQNFYHFFPFLSMPWSWLRKVFKINLG